MESLEDFSYIIKRYAPAQICFGSTLERETLPKDARLMNSFMRRKNPTVAIAADDTIHPKDEEPVKCHCKELTKNGYGPLASKVPRFAPEPTKKAKNDKLVSMVLRNEPIQVMKQCAQPFGRSMKQRDTASNTPGPGRFNGVRKRKIIMAESFGGRRRLIPAVVTVCMPTFIDACNVCKKIPCGMYWKNFRVGKTLCRWCKIDVHKQLQAENSKDIRKHFELLEYQRTRYCDYLHNHHNTTAKIQVISRRALTNLLRVENYLSTFHM